MAQVEQVGSGFHKARFVIGGDVHHFVAGPAGPKHDDRNPLGRQVLQGFAPGRVRLKGGGDQPRDAVTAQQVEVVDLFLGVLSELHENTE